MAKMIFNKKESKGSPFPWVKTIVITNIVSLVIILGLGIIAFYRSMHG